MNDNNNSRVIFSKATGFKNREEEDSYDVDGTSLFRVRGTCPEDVMTTQIQPECVSIFLLGENNQSNTAYRQLKFTFLFHRLLHSTRMMFSS